jgi:hypothetical protein
MRAFISMALAASLAAYAQQPAPQTTPQNQPQNQDSAPPTIAASAPASPGTIVVPAGTKIQLYLSNPLNSRTAQVGDVVHAEVAFPVVVNQRLVIPRGAFADGAVTKITRPGFSHHANISIQFTRIIFENGYSVSLTSATAVAANKFSPGLSASPLLNAEPSETATVAANLPEAPPATTLTSAPFTMLFFQTAPPLPKLPGPPKGFIIGAAVSGAIGIFLLVYGISHRGGDIYLHSGWQLDMVLQTPVAIDADRATAPVTQ